MVKFKKSFRNYVSGDVAGFSKQHEAWLISKNIAEKHVNAKKEVEDGKSSEHKAGTGEAGKSHAGASKEASSSNPANDSRAAVTREAVATK